MKNEPYLDWDAKKGIATCILTNGQNSFVGIASCHPDDQDMMNEKTGYTIAINRAKIEYLKHLRDNELQPRLAGLKQLYYSMNRSKYFNDKSYETRMLKRQIYLTQTDLDMIKKDIKSTKQDLKNYIDGKEEFYKKIRENRQKDKNN